MVTHRLSQLTLLPVAEVVPCLICGVGLATLDQLRAGDCYDGKAHQVSRVEYFRLYRLSQK